jgi:signal transduction histidine kinase
MTARRPALVIRRIKLPRPTVRLRLTAWYGGLFLLSGAVLLVLTYALVVRAFAGDGARAKVCRGPRAGGSDCHIISAQQARAIALDGYAAALHELVTRSAIALAIMAVVSIVLGWFIAGRVLRPLRTITATALQVSASSLNRRLAMTGPQDELKELADTFDGLLARLEASFTAQRQFIANAAHELRTPLARQRVISQVAVADPAATKATLMAAHERVLASGAQQQQLIDGLLTLARGQLGLARREPFDLAAVTRQVVAGRQSEARYRNLSLNLALAPAAASGNPVLAERLIANLVDNALRHNVPDGRVDVTTRTANSGAILAVTNTGPLIPHDSVDRLFEPFQRLATDRTAQANGLGLGLSIVRAIAEAHRAGLTACPQPGGGLLVEVTFPGSGLAAPAPLVRNPRPEDTGAGLTIPAQ